MKKHIGSTIALVFGVLALLAGITQPGAGNLLIAGPVIILGSLAYRSAKKRKLGIVKSSNSRLILEILAVCVILALVLLQQNLAYHITVDPVPNLIIPLWAIIAYLVIIFKKKKEVEQDTVSE